MAATNGPEAVIREFVGRFGTVPQLVSAPGRINLIGEHTDYNQGLVMPATIALRTWVAAAARPDRELHVRSMNLGETVRIDLDAPSSGAAGQWSAYVAAVATALTEAGHRLRGADLLVSGELPIGAGLSSSASLQVATARALLRIAGSRMDNASVARLCQRAESAFVGLQCGIMDQYAVACGEQDQIMMLDCRTLETRMIPFPGDAALIVVDSGIRHRLTDSAYNLRRQECDEAVAVFAQHYPLIESLRDLDMDQLQATRGCVEPRVYRRARHVVSENLRVESALEALVDNDLERLGQLLTLSHQSLRDDYEVSCAELDELVNTASRCHGVHGARLTGAGFGGCIIALATASAAEEAAESLGRACQQAGGSQRWTYVAGPARRRPPSAARIRSLTAMSLQSHSHRRRNLLTNDWVLVSPQRTLRPWHGQIESVDAEGRPAYDAGCYLCPRNERAGGVRNPDYAQTFVFDNDFPALSLAAGAPDEAHPLFQAAAEQGCCRVVCYAARHDQRLATLSPGAVVEAFETLFAQFVELDARDDIAYVQVFENRGQMMGCSNPHPHAQIWATGSVPVEPAKELQAQLDYYAGHGRPLLTDYLAAELDAAVRVVYENEHTVGLVPFWAVWPYETLLIPRRAVTSPSEMTQAEVAGFAAAVQRTLQLCEALFAAPVPYSMGLHARPSDGASHPEWQFHAHIYPPLLRSASVRKHLVGFEMLGMPQRDMTPEAAAERLRSAPANGR